jgi:hypothetical protein
MKPEVVMESATLIAQPEGAQRSRDRDNVVKERLFYLTVCTQVAQRRFGCEFGWFPLI